LFRYIDEHFPFFRIKVTCNDLVSLMFIRHFFSQVSRWSRWLCNLLAAVTT
jgi:hypothetical protein